jgi:hypothetical protein
MWGFLAGITLWAILYPFLRDWQQRRVDKRRLADMRKHVAQGHRWDVLQGRWLDE